MASETPWVWDDRAKRWRERASGRFLGPARLDRLRDGFVDAQALKTEQLVARLENGETLQTFEADMRSLIKDTYAAAYMLARGGRHMMSFSDWGRVGGLCRVQYQYLHDMLEATRAGTVSLRQLQARLRMYIRSATQAHERGKAVARGLVLPAYPGDGSSECRSNCRCSWRITEDEDTWHCYWMTRAGENCPTCITRGAAWNPLDIPKTLARSWIALRRLLLQSRQSRRLE